MKKKSEENSSKDQMQKPSADDLFATDINAEISESDVFVGNDDFFQSISQDRASANKTATAKQKFAFSTTQKILAATIITLLLAVSYISLKPKPQTSTASPVSTPVATNTTQQSQPQTQLQPQPVVAAPKTYNTPEPSTQAPPEPVSLRYAEKLYLQRNYKKAFDLYKKIFDRFSMPDIAISKDDELLRDLCRLKMAFCKKADADYEAAYTLLRHSLQSHSPAIKAFANYKLSFIDIFNKQYKKARSRAYQALTMADAIDFNPQWTRAFKSDCHFLIGQAITQDILSLTNNDKNMPENTWRTFNCADDPFMNLERGELVNFLTAGSEQLDKALFVPKIQKQKTENDSYSYNVICRDCSVEEIVSRFASDAKINISWINNPKDPSSTMSTAVRNRPITLYIPSKNSKQIIELAAGCAGLLADTTGENKINIRSIEQYDALDEHVALLNKEAISLWGSFLLTYYDDPRIPNAHFILGKLLTVDKNIANAIAEYKITAARFPNTTFAPAALLHSSFLKSEIHDYFGAGQDLEQLIQQYPDSSITEQAGLYLADTNYKTENYELAAKKYQKVYYLSPEKDYQRRAALGTAKSFFIQKDYIQAEQWFDNYFKLVEDKNSPEFYTAYFTYGQTLMKNNKLEEACQAFKNSLHDRSSKDQYLKSLLAMIDSYIKKKDFLSALKQLEEIPPEQFSPIQYTKIQLVQSKVLRSIGLTENAQALLHNKADYISDPQLKSKILFEVSLCYIDQGNLKKAEDTLAKIITIANPGEILDKAKLQLADVFMDQNKPDKAIELCNKIIENTENKTINQQASKIASLAYKRKDNYNKAAAVLLKDLDITSNN